MVEINGGRICVEVKGSDEQVIVLLHGGGIVSPVLELRPLVNFDHFKTLDTVTLPSPCSFILLVSAKGSYKRFADAQHGKPG